MKILVAFGLCVILFTASAGERGVVAVFKARRLARELSAEIGVLRSQNARLRARAEALKSDPATIERVARETLGLGRADELVVIRSAR